MKFEVKKIDGTLLFEADIECNEDEPYGIKLGLAIHWGYKNNKPLEQGDYRNAVFKGLTFYRSRFNGSRFNGSTFYRSTFNGSTFDGSRFNGSTFNGSRFNGSKFNGSKFDGSKFDGSTFNGSRFNGSRFNGSKFDGSTFDGATFDGATFDEKTLRNFKHDLWGILIRYKNEVPALVDYIKKGKINGSCYSGECACLMGTFAKIKNLQIENDEFSIKDSSSPAEQWFMMIKPGDTPENNFASKMALKWIEEFLLFDGHKNA